MTVTISEINDWFRGERLAAAHNALFEIVVQGAHADVVASASILLARLKMGAGHVDSAIMQLDTAPAPGREDRARCSALMALGYAFKRCFGLAGSCLREARDAGVEDPFVDLCAAMVSAERGDLLAAAGLFGRALGDHADRRFAFKGLAEVQRAAGDRQGASRTLEGLLEHDGDWAGTHRALAYHAMAAGDFDVAVDRFGKALEAAPGGDYAGLDRFALGRARHAAGRRSEAIASWQGLVSTEAGSAIMARRAISLLEQADEQARRHVLDIAPATPGADVDLPPPLTLYVRLWGRQPVAPAAASASMPPWWVVDDLEAAGFHCILFDGTPHGVGALIEAGIPVLTFEHFPATGLASVAVGRDDALAEVIAMDPATGLLVEIPYEQLSETDARGAPPAIAAVPMGDADAGSRLESSGVHGAEHLEAAARGEKLRDAGHLEEAEEAFRASLEKDPRCETAHAGLIGLLLGRMASDLSSDPPRQAVDAAMDRLRDALPGRAIVHRFEGRIGRVLGQNRKALKSFKRAGTLDPDDIHALCEQASCLAALGTAEEGSALLHQALDIAPSHPRSNLELADHHAGRRDFGAAEHYVRCALDLDPGSAYGHEILAMVHRSRDEHEQALASLETAASLGSDTDWVHLERAANLMSLERWQEARKPLETVVERDGANADARARFVEVLSHLGEGARAVEEATFLLSLDPGLASSQELLGLALETEDKLPEAEQAYARALELSQEHMPARRRLDDLLGRQGRNAERVGLWLVAARRDPADAGIMSGLADALETEDKLPEAEMVRRRASICGGGAALERLEALRAECAQSADPRAVLEDAAREWDEAAALAELGRLLLMTSDPDAPAVWKRVVSLEPADPVAIAMLAHAMRLDDQRRTEMDEPRDPDALAHAAAALEHVLTIEPYWIWVRAERGLVALGMNAPQDAIDVLEPVTEDAPAAWDVRLSAYSRLGMHDLAARAGDRLIETSNPRPADLIRIAREHHGAGNAERASEIAERAAAALPPGPSALRTQAESLIK
ncbi:MAG: hypothetical protein JRG91_02715 [Deltaproteobacteria bacterium]|nr:hypothetical protein [Deltaproteobacteria bacterium]